ncbi:MULTISPECIES: G1 family glutamic endopeptidase [Clostridium]|uniref:G1 family glutamic endopeptidase n=1 Tax=Clostridium TaxID=1485 RepID=UPI0008244ABB|nr:MULTISPECIES: G1 family glutamic endopeptidase [Clostridium]PJI10517.1 peptidase A4 family protein [Clostridium sp. CT7]
MRNSSKKVLMLSLSALVVLGNLAFINKFSYKNPSQKQYVLSSYFPKRNLIRRQIHKKTSWQLHTTGDSNNWQNNSTQNAKPQNTSTVTSLPASTEGSKNWAGYIDTPNSNNSYNSVSGSWIVPNISEGSSNSAAAQWIGLGGVTSSDLLQMGTMEQLENGQPVAEVFWEQLPSASQEVMSVPIGSKINVNISKAQDSSSVWNLTFTANTPDNKIETKTISVTLDPSYIQGIGTSAEWISEDPSSEDDQLFPLANMGTIQYQSALVNGQPLNASANNAKPVAMVSSNDNTIMISPSSLGSDGESFSTTTLSSNESSDYNVRRFKRIMPDRRGSHFYYDR